MQDSGGIICMMLEVTSFVASGQQAFSRSISSLAASHFYTSMGSGCDGMWVMSTEQCVWFPDSNYLKG